MSASSTDTNRGRSTPWRWVLATLAVGVASGCAGLLVTAVLRSVQRFAYDYPAGHERFLDGVMATTPSHRFTMLLLGGLVVGLGWWALDRHGRKRVSIEQAIGSVQTPDTPDVDGPPPAPGMPFFTTLLHALLQVVSIGLGSPLGREVAPREIGAAFAGVLARRARLCAADVRILIACGAGAGLAAVYNVPFAGCLFTLEVLLGTLAWRTVVPAVVSVLVATGVSRFGLGDERQYAVPAFAVDETLLVWAALAGPLIGLAATAFRKGGVAVRLKTPHDGLTAVAAVLVFAGIGLLAGPFPALLGNGKGPAQVGFDGGFAADTVLAVLVLKVVIVYAAIRVGAYGGLLTPAIACGALLATGLGAAWTLLWPGAGDGAYALVGATVFLSVSMARPVTAVALLFEMTAMSPLLIVPIAIALTGATVAERGWARRIRSGVPDAP